MAPEQFHGKAVFASDIYSVGVTMYQMLTGSLPYDTPAPADIARLARGELLTPRGSRTRRFRKRSTTSSCGRWRPRPTERYQRAADLLDDVLARARAGAAPRASDAAHGNRRRPCV